VPDIDGPVPVVVAAGTAVVPATEDPVPVVATEPAVVAAGTAVVPATEDPVPVVANGHYINLSVHSYNNIS
jgi:hypothetical protein